MRILISGSIAFDTIMSFSGRFSEHFLPDKLDRISVSFLVDSMTRQHGGVGANIAYNLALLGERPILFGTVGQDFASYRQALETAGVDVFGVRTIADEFTASCFINTDQRENQIVFFYVGAMREAGKRSIESYRDKVDLAVISPNAPDAMVRHAAECKEFGISYVWDPSQQIVNLDGASLRKGAEGARLLIMNEYEEEMFLKKTGCARSDLLSLSKIVVVTLGENGSEIRTAEGILTIPPVRPEAIVDPTGVGDAYRSGLIKGMAHGLDLEPCGRMGSLAAAYVLETRGTQNHRYAPSEFLERYARVFGPSDALSQCMDER